MPRARVRFEEGESWSATVLNVLYDERVGGPQLRVLQVAARLRQRGFETVVAIPRGDPTFASLLQEARAPLRELDLVRLRDTRNPVAHAKFLAQFWPNVTAFRHLIQEHHVEIVHTNGLINIQAAVAARLEGVKLVWHLNDVETPRPLRLTLLPLVQLWADRIAIAAQAVGRNCFPDSAELDGRLHLLYAPVDTERFSPEVDGSPVRAEFRIAENCPVVGIVANVCPGKGLEYLLEAAPVIKRRFPAAKFIFVGGMLQNRRAYWTSLLRRTEELGLAKDIFFTGRRNDVPQIMRAMTVLVQASESEACPMVVLEASASGLPVVATDVGGTPELVQDGVTGLLIKPRRPSEIADAVIRVLESPELARRIGMAGVERMRRFFSLDVCVAEHVCLYTAVLNGAAPASERKE